MNQYEYKLRGLGCANCAAKIERHVSDLPWVKSARVDFATSTLFFDPSDHAAVSEETIQSIVTSIEPDVIVTPSHENAPEKRERNVELFEIVLSLILFLFGVLTQTVFTNLPSFVAPVFYLASAGIAGKNVFIKGIKQGLKLRLDENTLMTIAVIAALCTGEFFEGTMVALLFKIGEYLEELAVGKSRRQIEALTEIRPDRANLFTDRDTITETDARTVTVGQTIVIRPFERVPLDCTVLSGSSEMDNAALTGESLPQPVSEGSALLSGMVNQSGLLHAAVTNAYADSAASRIIEMVRSAAAQKATTERTITKFARYYTPTVVLFAVFLSVLPPLLGLGTFSAWLSRGLVFLVASCPCALVIAVPLGFFSAVGGMSKQGILVKGGKYIEALAKVRAVAFDKTGTLTQGTLHMDAVLPAGGQSGEELLALAAAAEQHSSHPMAQTIVGAAQHLTKPNCRNFSERPGLGVLCEAENGQSVVVGRKALLEQEGVDLGGCQEGEVYVALGGKALGSIRVSDTIRPGAPGAVEWLRSHGVKRVVMLTGDSGAAAGKVAGACGISEVYHSLLPQYKVALMQRIRGEEKGCVFVGDGINDAPVLAASSCGVAMGLGSQAAVEAADMVLTAGTPDKLPDAIALSRRAMKVIKFNITFALACKFAVLLLAVFGLSPMWLAVFADVGVTILSVLISSRLMHIRKAGR